MSWRSKHGMHADAEAVQRKNKKEKRQKGSNFSSSSRKQKVLYFVCGVD
jgi:hypothetical protein